MASGNQTNKRSHKPPVPIIYAPDIVVDKDWRPIKNSEGQHRAKNDPYNSMESHQTRPSHIKSTNNAKNTLKQAESSAASASVSKASSSPHIAEQVTSDHSSHRDFKNSVEGRPDDSLAKKSQKGLFKGKGPLTFILLMLFGGGALFFSGQSVLGPHISVLYTQATDVQFTSYSLRNQRLFKFMLDGGDQIRITPFSQKFTTFTPYMKSRLANNGIEVGHLNADGTFASGDFLSGQSRALQFNGETIEVSDFSAKYLEDVNFRDAYYQAKRGRVAGFFDDASDWVYKKLGLTRNIFNDYSPSGDAATDTQNFEGVLGSNLGGTDTNINTASHVTDDNGTPNDPSDDFTRLAPNGDDINVNEVPGDTPEIKAHGLATDLLNKVSNVGGIACTALRVANLANIAAFAASTANSINYAMGLVENISKMLAGEGDASAINDVLNFFTTSTTSKVPFTDASGNTSIKEVTGSPLQSTGSRIVLGGIIPTKYDLNAYSLESITSSAKRTALVKGGTAVACSSIQAASAIISLAATSIPGGTIAKVVIGMLAETVGGIIVTGIMASVVSAIVPVLARALFTNVLEAYTGIPAGDLFSQGFGDANANVARIGSAYTPGSQKAIENHARATAVVLAQEAELDRLHRSPFDITSKNTFLGSLVVGFLPLLTSSSPATPISTLGSLTSNAVHSLLPSAFADTPANNSSFTTVYNDCSTIDKEGIKCNIYGRPIMTSDLSTIDVEPDDATYETVIMRNLSADATEVKDNSELAKFITFCANRESPFGINDANILNALQSNYGVILNNLPFLNNVVQLVNAAEDIANLGWATGENCFNSSDNPRWDNEFKYYQRFIEDSRILGQMDEDGENPILVFQEKYYTKHPLDNSPQGYLARITGMTKDDIAFLLEFIDYYNFLAEYDPTDLYPVAPVANAKVELSFVSNFLSAEQSTTLNHILYADVRNRNYAV